MTSRWSIRRSAAGLWVVRCTTTRVKNRFGSWQKAVTWVVRQISRFVVREALRHAEQARGEWIEFPAHLIDHPKPRQKQRRIIEAAWWRRLSVITAIDGDHILVAVRSTSE